VTLIDREEQDQKAFTILRCEDCSLVFVPEGGAVSPDYVALSDDKIDEQHVWLQTEHKSAAHRQAFAILGRHLSLPPDGRKLVALEVGCGVGGWLASLPDTYDKFGFDASEAQVRIAVSRFPQCRTATSIAEYARSLGSALPRCDVVAMWDVLEHVRQPVPFLAEIRSVLQPGGVVFASTPAAGPMVVKSRLIRWGWPRSRFSWSPSEHVAYYSPGTVCRAFRSADLEPLEVGAVVAYPRRLSPFEVLRRAAFAVGRAWLALAPQIYVVARAAARPNHRRLCPS
jgi:SAM-dependent methyltransferase